MILISHRGNVRGPNIEKENSPDYITKAMAKYNVEIDVWLIDKQFLLGHDKPTYPINSSFLQNSKLWCHAKNLDALTEMLAMDNVHCFWHQDDDVTLTSQNYIWTYPGKHICNNMAIAVIPERVNFTWDISDAIGVCSDFIERY